VQEFARRKRRAVLLVRTRDAKHELRVRELKQRFQLLAQLAPQARAHQIRAHEAFLDQDLAGALARRFQEPARQTSQRSRAQEALPRQEIAQPLPKQLGVDLRDHALRPKHAMCSAPITGQLQHTRGPRAVNRAKHVAERRQPKPSRKPHVPCGYQNLAVPAKFWAWFCSFPLRGASSRSPCLKRDRRSASPSFVHSGLLWLIVICSCQSRVRWSWLAPCASSLRKDIERGDEREQNQGVRSSFYGLAFLLLSAPVAADEPDMKAELSCRSEAAPGRVLCELKYLAKPGARLVWADALVMEAPEFVRPLRARVTPERFKGAGSPERKVSLAFVAAKAGVGAVVVKARVVVCRGEGEQERCRPQSQDVRAEIRVGG
jgi:hypothetical protein